jgi:signal transduction histidine kinase
VRVPFAIAGVAAGLFAEVAALVVLGRAGSSLLLPMLASVAQFGALGVVGSLVLLRRPAHRIGWAMVLASTWTAVVVVASTYLATERGGGLLAEAAFGTIWLSEGPLLGIWLFFLYTFPTGTFASRPDRRAFVALTVIATVALFVLYLVAPAGVAPSDVVPVDLTESVSGPFALGSGSAGWVRAFAQLSSAVAVIGLFALIRNYIRGDAFLRAQVRYVVWAVAAYVVLAAVAQFLPAGRASPVVIPLLVLSSLLAPVAILIAIERSRLWDIDRLVSRAVAYVALSVALTVAIAIASSFAGLAFGEASLVISLIVAFAFAVVAEPLRRRIERITAGALSPGGPDAAAAFAALAAASDRTATRQATIDLVRGAMISLTGADRAGVWLAVSVGGTIALRATDAEGPSHIVLGPSDLRLLAAGDPVRGERLEGALGELLAGRSGVIVPILARGDVIGALTVIGASRRTDDAVLRGVAGHAALALREQRLTEELRARLDDIALHAEALRSSQQRLAAAQLDERRRIERDLHDGAQQRLIALALELTRLSEQAAPDTSERIRQLRAMVEDILQGLRDLARGIYPDVLADHGLARALTALAREQILPVRVEIDPALAATRLPREAEAALYFTALEAITNAARHARATAIRVTLGERGGRLALTVEDDGSGFEPAGARIGVGLRNMSDRMTALGGTCEIESAPGQGTRVRAAIALDEPAIRSAAP